MSESIGHEITWGFVEFENNLWGIGFMFLLIPNKYRMASLVNLTLENVNEWSDHEII